MSRTAVLVHLVDLAGGDDPLVAYDAVNHELAAFDAALAAKPQIVVGTKLDVTEARDRFATVREAFAARGIEILGISAVSGDGVRALLIHVADAVRRACPRRARAAHAADNHAATATAEHAESSAGIAADTAHADASADCTVASGGQHAKAIEPPRP